MCRCWIRVVRRIRLLSNRIVLLGFLWHCSHCFICISSWSTTNSEHLTSRVYRSLVLIIAHLTVHMTPNTNIVSASRCFFNLLAILACSYITTEKCFLLLNLAHFSIPSGCWWSISVACHAWTCFWLSLHGLCVRPCETITIILRTVCICYEGLVLVCSCRVLANVHELRHRGLLNSWFRKLLVNSLIDCRSVSIRFCARPTALIIDRCWSLFLLTLQQLLHQLVVLVNRERLATLAMSCLHLLMDTWLALDHALRVIMLRSTCF